MATLPPSQAPTPSLADKLKLLLVKVVVLVLLGILLGLGYDWAAPRLYGADRFTGFRLGVVHGALMPVALPALLMGRDAPIYAANNTGRIYKIGYIAGINLCGMLFFGAAFWRPRKP